MGKMWFAVAVMTVLIGFQTLAEARGGGGGGMGGGGTGMTSFRSGADMGRGDMLRTRQQDRLRDCDLSGERIGEHRGDQSGTRQRDRLRDPSLHTGTETTPDVIAEAPAE